MSFEQCKKVASAYMQVVRKVFYRNIRTGIAQDIGGSLGDIEIIIRFQGVIGSVGSFAELRKDSVQAALDMAFVCRGLLMTFHHVRDDICDILRAGVCLDRGFLIDMAALKHIGYRSSIEADPGIRPGVTGLGPVKDKSTGSDEKILVLIDNIMCLIIIEMPLSVQYKVKDIIMADDGAV